MPDNFVLDAYKRHFSKAKKAFEALDGPFNLSFSYHRDEGSKVELKTPNDDNVMRFVVLMRRFLNSADHIYCRNVWQIIKNNFTEILPEENVGNVDQGFVYLSRGFGEIIINGKSYSNEGNYHLIANGGFFSSNDEEAVEILSSLSQNPAYLYLLFEFYTYNTNMFALAQNILHIILNIEKSIKYQNLFPKRHFADKRCLFCMSDKGPFTSEEHIVPEALGNYDTVLPEGYICNSCNNTKLSKIDSAFVDSDLLGLLRVYFVPYNKTGKFPTTKYQNTVIQKVSPTVIRFYDTTKKNSLIIGKKRDDGLTEFTIHARGKNAFNPRIIGRAVYKIGLEMVAFILGKDAACDAKYDAARAFILEDQDFPNNLLIRKHFQPSPQVKIHYDVRFGGSSFILDVYGVTFMFNLEVDPLLHLTDMLAEADFESFSLMR